MAERDMDCLACGGRGNQFYICGNKFIECVPCGGTGRSRRDPAWVEQGQRLRAHRIGSEMSLGDLARRLGVSVVAISDAERGRADPGGFLAAIGLRWEQASEREGAMGQPKIDLKCAACGHGYSYHTGGRGCRRASGGGFIRLKVCDCRRFIPSGAKSVLLEETHDAD